MIIKERWIAPFSADTMLFSRNNFVNFFYLYRRNHFNEDKPADDLNPAEWIAKEL